MDKPKKTVTVTRLPDREKIEVVMDEVQAWGCSFEKGEKVFNIIVCSIEIPIAENWEELKKNHGDERDN